MANADKHGHMGEGVTYMLTRMKRIEKAINTFKVFSNSSKLNENKKKNKKVAKVNSENAEKS